MNQLYYVFRMKSLGTIPPKQYMIPSKSGSLDVFIIKKMVRLGGISFKGEIKLIDPNGNDIISLTNSYTNFTLKYDIDNNSYTIKGRPVLLALKRIAKDLLVSKQTSVRVYWDMKPWFYLFK